MTSNRTERGRSLAGRAVGGPSGARAPGRGRDDARREAGRSGSARNGPATGGREDRSARARRRAPHRSVDGAQGDAAPRSVARARPCRTPRRRARHSRSRDRPGARGRGIRARTTRGVGSVVRRRACDVARRCDGCARALEARGRPRFDRRARRVDLCTRPGRRSAVAASRFLRGPPRGPRPRVAVRRRAR